jgi:mono/diheme cytochrome c family protein
VRRLLPLALALSLPLLVIACGGGETEDTLPENVDTTQAETGGETDTGAPAETGEAGGGGGGGEGDPEAGASVFESAGCGSCHTFEAAGTSGTIGPNLDESDIDFEGAVQQITNGGGGMQAYEGQLSEEEIANVAAFVTQSR